MPKFKVIYQLDNPGKFNILDVNRQVASLQIDESEYQLELSDDNSQVILLSDSKEAFEDIKKVLSKNGKVIK